jgi:hypothetical protein
MNRLLILLLLFPFVLFSQTERKVLLLDLTETNNESNLSRYYAVEDILDFCKVPYDTSSDLNLLQNYPVVITASRFTDGDLSLNQIQDVQTYVQNGGVIISSSLREAGLFPVFGISSSTSNDSLFYMNFDTLSMPSLFQYVDDSLEVQVSLGRPSSYPNFFTREYVAQTGSELLAAYENGSPALIKHSFGNGYTYLFGPDFRDVVYRNRINADVNAHRTYSNGFEPTTDVFMFIIRNIIRAHIPHTIYPHTVPGNASSVLFLTHDVDSRTAIDTMHFFSTYENQLGVEGHYNVTCRYLSDNWMTNFYIGATAEISQLLNDGHKLASHSVGHYPDYADFEFGSLGNTTGNYAPFYGSGSTTGGTVLGELEVSRDLLEGDFLVDVKSFRAGHLAFPDSLIIGLDTLGYAFNSTYSANDILTSYPYYGYRRQKFTTWRSPVLEIPMTISDVFSSGGFTSTNYGQRVDTWLEASYKYRDNHAPINLLIHPNRQFKLTAQQDYINGLPNDVVVFSFEDYGDFWKERTALDYNTALNNDTLLVNFNTNPSLGMSFLLDYDGLDTVLFFDNLGSPISFQWKQWNNRQRLYYQDELVSINEAIQNENKLTLYPNPAESVLHVQGPSEFSTMRLRIYDLSGRLVFSQAIFGSVANVSVGDFEDGVYILSIQNGTKVYTKKWIKS